MSELLEVNLLGAMILDGEACENLIAVLETDDFTSPAHRLIFRHVVALFFRNQPIDFISVTDSLRAAGQVECIGGSSYIMSLVHSIPTTAGIEQRAWKLVEKRLFPSVWLEV